MTRAGKTSMHIPTRDPPPRPQQKIHDPTKELTGTYAYPGFWTVAPKVCVRTPQQCSSTQVLSDHVGNATCFCSFYTATRAASAEARARFGDNEGEPCFTLARWRGIKKPGPVPALRNFCCVRTRIKPCCFAIKTVPTREGGCAARIVPASQRTTSKKNEISQPLLDTTNNTW